MEVPYSARYPRAVCADCARRACDEHGRQLVFYNESLSGGFAAYYADTGEAYISHSCYINGLKCRADEAHLSGIVIEVI